MVTKLESLEDLTTWTTYREFMKERLKQLPDEECAFYLSKKKLEFDVDGKPWKGHAVLIGKKGELAAKKIRKQGTQFHIGTCRPDDKKFEVSGDIPANLLKQAHLTLKKMRYGYSIAGSFDGDDDESEDAEAPRAGSPLERAPEVWTLTRRHVKTKTDQLSASVRQAFAGQDGELVSALDDKLKALDRVMAELDDELGQILSRASAAPDDASRAPELKAARALLAKHIKYVTTDPLIHHIDTNPFGVPTNLRATLTKSLKQLALSVGS